MTLSAIYEDLWRIITMILYLFRIPIKFFNLAEFELKILLAAGKSTSEITAADRPRFPDKE